MDFARLPYWNRQSPLDSNPIPAIAVPQDVFNPVGSSLQSRSSLIVIDPTVENYQALSAGVQNNANVLILNPAQDAIAQITAALLGQSEISSLHLVSHGASGALKLSETWLDRTALDRYQTEFQIWHQALTADADILLYGCDVAQGSEGQDFIQRFSQLTGAEIAASDDLTGNAALYGDWTLEAQTGKIESAIAFDAETQASYQSILPVDLISVGNPTLVKGSAGLDNIGRNAVSGDGRYVVFTSSAATFGGSDNNGAPDVFLYDRQTDAVTLISRNVSKSGSATGTSFNPVISYDGNYVAFISNANDLVSSMTGNATSADNIFVWERATGNISLVSQDSTGKSGTRASSAPSISDDGSRIAFQTQSQLLTTDRSIRPDIYVWSRSVPGLTHVSRNRVGASSVAQGADSPIISGDGRYVAFAALYSNLAPGDTNTAQDIFLWQQETDTVVNLTATGNAASLTPVISQDGSRVVFVSTSTTLVPDTVDENGVEDVFIWIRDDEEPLTGTIQLVSLNAAGDRSGNSPGGAIGIDLGSKNPAISRDGQVIAFTSASTDLVGDDTNNQVDVFARNLLTGEVFLVNRSSAGTVGNGGSGNFTLSEDGSRIAFTSLATNLVTGDTNGQQDVFVRDISVGQPDSGKTFLISRTSTGGVGNNASGTTASGIAPSISVPIITSDGTSVVFVSQASNLNPDDTNSQFDGFVIPVSAGNATLISRRNTDPNLSSRTGSGDSILATANSIDNTGRYVVFTSTASDVVDGDTNGIADVFLRDRQTETITLISRGTTIANGASGNATLSADGRYIVFTSDATNLVNGDNNNATDIFWVDRQTNQLRLVSRAVGGATSANAAALNPVMSADGRYVAFVSAASNLASGDTNGQQDVFVWDSADSSILNITQGATNGISEQPVISADGRYVAFVSAASTLVSGDSNSQKDVFVWDRVNNIITLVSRATGATGAISDGASYGISISQDGRTIAFTSAAKNLAGTADGDSDEDVFVRNLDTNTTVLVSVNQAGGYSISGEFTPLRAFDPKISSNGRFVTFTSTFSDLVANDSNGVSDVFLRDLTNNVTKLISVNTSGSNSGNNANGADGGIGSGSGTGSFGAAISNDGRYVIFNSFSSDLVNSDTNGALDVFIRDINQNATMLASQNPAGTNSGRGASFNPVMSGNGGYVAFTSAATDLVERDLNGKYDVFGLRLSDTVSLSLSKATIAESTPAESVQYTIRRNQTSGTLPVKLAIDNTSTASATDYTLTAGTGITLTQNGSELTVEFADGVSEGVLTLTAIDDAIFEGDETLKLNVVASPNYGIANGFETTSLTLIDDDTPISVSVTNITVDSIEGNSGEKDFTFQVKLGSPATKAPVTVQYATQEGTAGANDFTATSGVLTFNVGESDTQTITVRVKGDTQFESDETFAVILSEPSANARLEDSVAVATIANDDATPTISLSIAGADSITEGQTGTQTYTLTVKLSEASNTPITVDYAAKDGSAVNGRDYVLAAGQLTFEAGVTEQTINVTVNSDRVFETDEQFQIELSNPNGVNLPDGQQTKTVTIANDDTAPTLSIEAVAEQSESTTPYNFVVKLTGETELPVNVNYATVPGTAIAGDFTSAVGTLTFAAGETQKTIAIAINDDAQRESNESFSVQLSESTNAAIATATATGTIIDNDPIPTVSITNVSNPEGNSGDTPFNFEVSLSNPSDQEIVLNYSTEDGTALQSDSDYQSASGTIRFAPGTTRQTITVNVNGDTKREQNETFSVKLSSTTPELVTIPANAIGIGTLENDDSTLPSISIAPATVNEGGILSFVVTLSEASSDEIRVNLATSDGTALVSDSDYTPRTAQTLIFAPNELTKIFTVETIGDNKLEDDEAINVTLSDPLNATITGTGIAIGAIKNDDQRPTIGIESTPLSEDDPLAAAYPFTIRLSNPTTQTVTVKYRTIDDTATVADNDYVTRSGMVTFNPGETEKTITVQANSDSKFEPTERFIVRLEEAVNADLSPTATDGFGVLNNDDAAPQLSIVSRTGAQAEGNTGTTPFVFAVSLNNPSGQEVRVNYTTVDGTATSPADFAAANGTLIFAPGQTEQTITVNVATDSTVEPDETFKVSLSNPIGATLSSNSEAQGTILNDDEPPIPTVRIDDVIASEGNSNTTYTFKVKLLQATTNTVTVQYRTLDGTATVGDSDYVGLTTPGTLTFAPGETEKDVSIVVRGDTKFEPNENFFVELFNPTNASLSTLSKATGVINNDDARPTISIGNVVVSEGNVDGTFTNATFTVSLSNPSSEAITVDYATQDGTAQVSDNDYESASGKLTFAPGVTSQQITVRVRGDRKFELDEAFSIRLSSPTNADLFSAPNQGIGTILSDDFRPTITIDDATPALEGNTGTTPIQFKVRLSNPSSETVTVKYATKNGTADNSDYTAVTPTTLTFAPGQTEQTITVQAIGDTTYELDEAFTVELSEPTNGQIADSSAIATISNDDLRPSITIDDATPALEGNTGTTPIQFKVRLSSPSTETVTVKYATKNGTADSSDYVGVTAPTLLTFAPGQTEQTITVQVTGDTVYELDEAFTVELSEPTNGQIADGSAIGTIRNDDLRPTITIDDATPALEGNTGTTPIQFKVRLSSPSTETVTVKYATKNGTADSSDYGAVTTPTTLTFAPGQTEQTITVQATGDTTYELDETFTLELSEPTNSQIADGSAIGTIRNDDLRPTITIDDATPALEGNTGMTPIQFKVRLSSPSSETVTVKYATKNGTADSSDYGAVTTPTTLTFAPGQTEQTITVQVTGDTVYELDETFALELSEPTNSQIADGSAVGTIRNDDPQPRLAIAAVPTSVPEGNSGNTPLTFEVSLSEASPTPITVRYSTADGTATIANNDYVAASGTLTFAAGETKKTITVNALGDTQVENDETLQVTLNTPTGATLQTESVTVTIANDDTPPTENKGDSLYDILWRNQRTGENMLWLPSGSLLDQELPFLNVPDSQWRIAGAADFSADGVTDLLWSNQRTGEAAIWQMSPDLSVKGILLPTTGSSSWEIKGIADFNRDRQSDILFRNVNTGENAIWFMRNTSLASAVFIPRVADTSWQINITADFDNDGNADIFWSNVRTGETALWLMDGATIKASRFLEQVPDLAWRPIASGDFNRDGFVDLFWRNVRTGENGFWLMRNGQLDRGAFILAVPPTGWEIEQVYDFNGDQSLDLLWRNTVTQEMAIWYLDREVFGTYAFLPNLPDRNWSVEGVGLLGNQKKPDLVLRNYQTGENRIWRINQDVFNRTTTLETLNRDWQVQGTGDFDRNGSSDIVWRNLRTSELTIWLTQNGQVQQKVPVPIGSAVPLDWKILAVDDFSGDSTPDLLWRNDRTGETALWLFNGTQFASTAQLVPAMDTKWQLDGVADMNSDRSLDLIWRNTNTGEMAYWFLDRTRLIRGVINPAIDLNWQIKGFADFNRDGQTDIVWRNMVTGENGVWIMSGTQITRSIKLLDALPSWDIVGIGEYNQDNQFDLVWRDRATGANAVWYLNNGNLSLGVYIPSLPDPAWTVENIDDF